MLRCRTAAQRVPSHCRKQAWEPGCRLDLGFQDVRLRRERHPKIQLLEGYFVRDGMSCFDEHFIGRAFGLFV